MAFNDNSITFGAVGLQGENTINPTALTFSQSGRPVLFATQQNGEIWRYEIARQPDGPDGDTLPEFVVTSSTKISDIKLTTQNYNDDGSVNAATSRQSTGICATTDADGNDVLYVSSSDWRIAVGSDSGLDTNSGQIHRLVLDKDTGDVLSNVAVVRGLPRSEENHSTNGLDLSVDPDTGEVTLWIAQGGNTNNGAPGNNFAGTVDFAYSGTVLKVNLTALDAYDVRTDGNGDRFILDLPTLNDPTRPDVDLSTLDIQNLADAPHFSLDDNGTGANGELIPDWAGGNNGLNMAKISDKVLVSEGGVLKIVDNPLSIHSPGYRNNYDVLVTQDGDVFTWDNGPNGGWGGQPKPWVDQTPGSDANWVEDWTRELAINDFNESGGLGFGDQLHYVGKTTDAYGPYGGFPNVLRAAKEVLDVAFTADGAYRPATPDDPVLDQDGSVIFANEAAARDYLSKVLIIWQETSDGVWENVTTALPEDLTDVVAGYHWSHPGSSIADTLAHFDGGGVMDGTHYSPESELLGIGEDGSLASTPGSTNGLAEYTASFFGNALNGAIIGASFDGNLYFKRPLDTDNDGRIDAAESLGTIGGFGSQPLAVAALGDDGIPNALIDLDGDGVDDFAGMIVAATYGADNLTFFVPGGKPADPSNDLDLDGVDNTQDSHVGDPLDGMGVIVGAGESAYWGFELNNPDSTPAGAVPAGDSIAGDIGLNAIWRNGVTPQVAPTGEPSLFHPSVWNLGGASSFISIDHADDGAAEGTANDQADVPGIGFAAPSGIGAVTISTEMVNAFSYTLNTDYGKTWDGGEKFGLMVGPGDQTTFVEATIAVVDDGSGPRFGLQLLVEENDSYVTDFVEIPGIEAPIRDLTDPNVQLEITVDMTPGTESVTARARYLNDNVYTDWVESGALDVPRAVAEAIRGQYTHAEQQSGAVVGMVSSTTQGDDSFAASWDWIQVDGTGDAVADGQVLYRWNAGSETVQAIDGGADWTPTGATIVGAHSIHAAKAATNGLDASVPDTTPTGLYTYEMIGTDETHPFGLEFGKGALATGMYAVRLYMGNGFAGTSAPEQRVFDVTIEDKLFLDDMDLSATLGHKVGGMFEWVGRVDDGTVDIDFAHFIENPLVNGVEILQLSQDGTAGPRISVLDKTAGEADGSVLVTVQSSAVIPDGESVTVSYEIIPKSATADQDYAAPNLDYDATTGVYSGTGTIAAGATGFAIPVEIVNDTIQEDPEAFEVRITGVSGAGATVGDGTATVTITDDDAPTTTGEVVYRWNAGASAVAAIDGGLDWSPDSGILVGGHKIAAAKAAEYGLDMSVPQDTTPTGLYTYEVYGTDATNPMGLEFGAGTLSAGTYAVRLFMGNGFSGTNDPGERVFDVSIEDQLAFDDVDLAALFGHKVGGMLEWTGDVTDGTLDIDFAHVVENPLIDGVEILRLADAAPATPVISVHDATVDEATGTAHVTIDSDIPVPTDQTVTVTYEIVPGTATPGEDYTAAGLSYDTTTGVYTGTGQIAGGSADLTIPIDIVDDAVVEGNEAFEVRLTGVSGAGATIGDSAATVIITDNDSAPPAPVVSVLDTTVDEAVGTASVTVQADVAVPDGESVTVTYEIAPGTATPGEDYTAAGLTYDSTTGVYTGTGTIAAGATDLVIPINIADDALVEGNEAFEVRLTGVSGAGATIGDGAATVTITDNDSPPPAPVVSVLDTTVDEAVGAASVTVQADVAVPDGESLTVTYEIAPGTATPGEDYTAAGLTFDSTTGVYTGTGTIAAGATDLVIPIDIVDDALVEGNEAFEVRLTGVSGAGATIGDGVGAVAITDNDSAPAPTAESIIRWNAGTAPVAAIDGGATWTTTDATLIGGTRIHAAKAAVNGLDASVPDTTPTGLYTYEVYGTDAANPMGLEFGAGTLASGTYAVRLFMGNGFSGTSQPGQRVFDVSIEDQMAFDDVDLSALFGHKVGGMLEWTGDVTDGTLDIDFAHVIENPLVNGVEVLRLNGGTTPPPAPVVSVLDATVDEAVGTASVTVQADVAVPDGESVTVTYEVVPGTATPGEDYTAAGLTFDSTTGVYTGTGTIAAGATDLVIPIDIVEDALVEGNEAFEVRLTGVSGAGATIGDSAATVTITDNDSAPPAPVVSVLDTTVDEAVGAASVTVQADVAVPDGESVTVTYEIAPGTATPGEDYTAAGLTFDSTTGVYTGTGTIAAGATELTIPIDIVDDALVEGNEAFEVRLTGVSGAGATIGDGQGTVAITDNDGTAPALIGSAFLGITQFSDDVQESNFGGHSFQITNTGDKRIASVELDVTGALYPDTVFDPSGAAGDSTAKGLTIDNAGMTGVTAPDASSYIGAGGVDGYEKVVLAFDSLVDGGFETSEKITFSVDMDPNSIAGSDKTTLNAGSNPTWDVGGVSGAELIGSSFTVTFEDGTTATGQLQGAGNQGGAQGVARQDSPDIPVTLTVNGETAGGVGTYGDGGPTVIVNGPAGETARVVLTKGFIQPTENLFTGDYATQLDAQLADLASQDFPANNAVEFQTVDVSLTGGDQDISALFDFSGVAAYDFAGEAQLPLGLVAGVVDPDDGYKPLGPVSQPIYLEYATTAPAPAPEPLVVHRVNAGGAAVAAPDGSLPDWGADTATDPSAARTGGRAYTNGATIDTSGVDASASDPALFGSERYGDMQWDFAVADGDYTAKLHFAEIFMGTPEGKVDSGVGARVFDVMIEDQLVLDDYDIYADVGAGTAVTKSFDVTVTDGVLDIDFVSVVDNAKISAIEIIDPDGQPIA